MPRTRDIGTGRRQPLADVTNGALHLLLIGIDKYEHITPLRTAVCDAKAVGEALIKHYGARPEYTITLFDSEATAINIEKAFRRLARQLKEDDRLLIYYAGHGEQDNITDLGFWLPVEALPDNTATWIDHQRIKSYLRALKARHVFLISDSCFAGDFFRRETTLSQEKEVTEAYVRQALRRRARQVLTSGGLEVVSDEGFEGHSVFAYFLLKALRENEEPWLLPSDIYRRVRGGVAHNANQMPILGHLYGAGGEEGAEFVLFRECTKKPQQKKKKESTNNELKFSTSLKISNAKIKNGVYNKDLSLSSSTKKDKTNKVDKSESHQGAKADAAKNKNNINPNCPYILWGARIFAALLTFSLIGYLIYYAKMNSLIALADYVDNHYYHTSDAATFFEEGNRWMKKGEYDKAIAAFTKAIYRDSAYAAAYNNLGVAWYNKGKYDEALKNLNSAIYINSNYPTAYYNRGVILFNKKFYQRSISDFSKAIDIDPNFITAYYGRARSYEMVKATALAWADYRKASSLPARNDFEMALKLKLKKKISFEDHINKSILEYISNSRLLWVVGIIIFSLIWGFVFIFEFFSIFILWLLVMCSFAYISAHISFIYHFNTVTVFLIFSFPVMIVLSILMKLLDYYLEANCKQ